MQDGKTNLPLAQLTALERDVVSMNCLHVNLVYRYQHLL